MWRRAVLPIAGALTSSACSFVFDTSELRDGDGGAGGAGASAHGGGGGATGGEGGAACTCRPELDVLWLITADDVSPSATAPSCPRGRAVASGAIAGSLQDDASVCGGPCIGPSRVKVAVDDTCGVLGDGIDNSGACDTKLLVPEAKGDTALAINLEPLPCTLAAPALLDAASVALATACSAGDGDCAPPAEARRCVASPRAGCTDPCFGEPVTLQAVADTRACDGVLATCSPAVFGELELYDDPACNGPATASWTLTGAAICPTGPTPPLSPSSSHWRFVPDPQPCDATAQPSGSIALAETRIELCCAP